MPARSVAGTAITRFLALAAIAVAVWLALLAPSPTRAQSPDAAPVTTTAAPKTTAEQPGAIAAAAKAGPTWNQLTSRQKRALNPLAANWNSLSEPQKRKWLALSQNYAKLSETEQLKLQDRMTDWSTLSSQERTQARLNYAETRKLTPEEKEAKWQAYQALSIDEKKTLARNALPKPKGAAAAVQPVPAYKLAVTPASRTDRALTAAPAAAQTPPKRAPGITAAAGPVNKNTLLPKTAAASAPRQP